MSLKIDRLQLEIIINNDQARKQLRSLDDEARQIRREMKGIAEGTQEWIQKTKRLNSIKEQMDGILEKIGLTGLSLKELRNRQKELNMILSQISPNLPVYKQYQDQLTAIKNRIGELTGKAQQSTLTFKGLADGFNRYFAIVTAGIAAFSGMVFSIKQLITTQGDLSDSLANIRKSTGMTAREVENLNKQLGKIDTRTSRQDLRSMAVVAGQLGIAKNDVLGFVESVDRLNVALGDEFKGGAEEIAREMGMLRNVLTDMKTGSVADDMMRVGNAINLLGAEGMATGPVMTDFASRIGGMGIPLGLASDEVLGLSATLQELNVHAERGGTAVVKILQKMTTNTEGFAKIAGMPVKEFTNLVNTDLFGAFMKVVEGSKRGGQSATLLADIIKELEISGVGASEIFAKLSTNTEMLTEKVQLAGTALQGTTSITNEFNIKNATLGAVLAKLQKDFYSLITMPNVSEFFKNQVYHVVQLVNWLKDLPLIIEKYRIGLIALTGITLAWVAAKTRSLQIGLLNNLMLKEGITRKIADEILVRAQIASEQLLTIWKGKGTVATKLWTMAQLVLNQAMKANPIGLLITAITALVGAIKAYDMYNDQTIRLEKEKAAAVTRLNIENDKLVKGNQDLNEQVKRMNQLSVQQKRDLQEKIEGTIHLAEAELALAEAKKLQIEKDSKQLSVWQFTWNWVKSSGFADWKKMNEEDLASNSKKATEGLEEGIEKIKQTIEGMKSTKTTVSDVINAEKLGDAIVARTFDALTEKLARYQTALRNTTAGSEDYNRIQVKIKETNKELAKFEQHGKGSGDGKQLSHLQNLNKELQEYMDLLGEQVSSDPAQAEITARKISRLKQEKKAIEELIDKLVERAGYDDTVRVGHVPSLGLTGKQSPVKLRDNADVQNPFEFQQPGALDKEPEVQKTETQIWAEKATNFLGYADTVMNGLTSIDQLMSNMENQQLQRDANANEGKKKNLKRQLDAKLINQKQYDAGVSKLDAELDAKKRKLAHDQAVRQKAISLVQAVINTAQGITASLAMMPPASFIMAALTGVLGAIQIGYIASTPIPEAAKGRYKAMQAAMGRYDVIGASDNKLYKGIEMVNSFTGIPGRPLLVNETGNEIVIDPYTTRNLILNYPEAIAAIEMARVPQRATGQYPASMSMNTKSEVSFDAQTLAEMRMFREALRKPIESNIVWDRFTEMNDTYNGILDDVRGG